MRMSTWCNCTAVLGAVKYSLDKMCSAVACSRAQMTINDNIPSLYHFHSPMSSLSLSLQSEGETEGAELQQKVETEAKAKVRALLGGRFIVIIVGGAPSGEDLKAFLKSLCPPYGMFGDGFGSTEVS